MAGRIAKTAKAAKPRASSKARLRAKASAKAQSPLKKPAKAVSAKTSSSKKSAPKTAVVKKPAARKPAVKSKASVKAAVKKKAPAAKKTAAKKPLAKKPAAKKAVAKKQVAKKATKAPKRAARTPVKAVDKVVAAARTMGKAKGVQASSADAKILSELADLAKFIRAAKREIAAIRPADVKDEYLPKAADELDAVVEATAEATNTIMDSCEVVEGVMGDVSVEVSAKLMDATTRIYEACTFQDITGQRIGKVVTTMKHIEECIDALIDAFGTKARKTKKSTVLKVNSAPKVGAHKPVSDAELLEGPQLGNNAKSQAEIDDLFSSFD